jgi:hypothetical protein
MRATKYLLATLLFTALAVAQSAPSSSSDKTSGTQTPDPNQQPTSPLQEPVKPTEAELNKPKAAKFDIGSGGNTGEDQQLGEIRLMNRYTEINGKTDSSFRVPGDNNLAEFNYYLDRKFMVTRRIQMLSMYRGTDDRSIDPERNSLQKSYVRIFGARDEFIIGDALVNFSRLSFNQNIKGVSATSRIGDNWKVSAVGGVFIDRYGSLYKDLIGKPYLSLVSGARLERSIFNKDSKFGINLSSARDQTDFLDQIDPTTGLVVAVGTSPIPSTNTLTSVDGKFQFKNGFRLDSEFAYSFTDFDRRFSALGCTSVPCDTRQPEPTLNRTQGDWGGRLESSYRYKKLSLRSSYVRYQPNFASVNARQISDLQDFVFRASYDLTNWLNVDGTVRRSNNDLKKQLAFQTTLWGPEMRFVFHDLALYKRASFEVGYRHRDISATNGSTSRFVRTPYAELTLPVKQTFFNIGYERRQAQDQIDARQTSNTDRVYAGLRGVYDIANWQINPSLRYELERESHRPAICDFPLQPLSPAPPLPADQPCNIFVDPALHRDSNRLGSASLLIDAPRYFILEMAFRSSSSTVATLTPFTDAFGVPLPPPLQPLPNGFSRPSYKAALTYKFHNDENMTFTFGFERTNNFYLPVPTAQPASPNDYDERIWSGTVLYRFGRRAQ